MIDNAANPSPSDVTKTNKNGSAETIGSRLRKRRRTNSSAPEDSPPPSKRVQVKKSATKKGTATRTIEPSNAATQDRQEMPAENVYDTAQSSHLPHKTDGEEEIVGQRPSSRLAEGDGAHIFHAVIADIINHGETVDNHYATRSYGDISMMNNGNFQHISASFNLKAQSLPVLDNLVSFRGRL